MSVPRIVVIEDNPSDVALLRIALQSLGEQFELEVLNDGQKAIEFVKNRRKTADSNPCVILLDLHLPKHDGLEVLRAIREEPVLSNIGVVALAGLASSKEEAELRRLGAHYRRKPVELAELSELAADVMAICKGLIPDAVTPSLV